MSTIYYRYFGLNPFFQLVAKVDGSLASLRPYYGSAALHYYTRASSFETENTRTAVMTGAALQEYTTHGRWNGFQCIWTSLTTARPRQEPPGGTWRTEILQGVTYCTDAEIEEVIREASHRFQGTSYNLLTKNCNHFTSYLCQKLTGKPAPAWLNRAASIGVALPCVVPREWIAPPDHDTADGELVHESDEEDERTRMLRRDSHRRPRMSEEEQDEWEHEVERISFDAARSTRPGIARSSTDRHLKDTSGREIPPSERAPLPER
jgi:PPPDE putative peptidase domain